MKVGVVISTVNEAETIGKLVRELFARDYFIYVVDGSIDNETWITANDAGANATHFPKPMGIAYHLQQGWKAALKGGCDIIVQMDAGGSHDPADIGGLIRGLETNDMVIGSRFMPGANYIGNRKRAFMSRVAAQMCNWKEGTRFTDWTSGYRGFRRDALEILVDLKYGATMHGFQIEVLDWACLLGFQIGEVPITYRAGHSSFNLKVAREALGVYWMM